MRDLGVSFAPTQDNAEDSRDAARTEGLPAAIQMLSLRLPRILGARAPVASALAHAPGFGGMGSADQQIFQVLQRLLGGGGDQFGADTMAPGGWRGSGPGIPNPAPHSGPVGPHQPPETQPPAPAPKVSFIPNPEPFRPNPGLSMPGPRRRIA
jgi:hypothetical protein